MDTGEEKDANNGDTGAEEDEVRWRHEAKDGDGDQSHQGQCEDNAAEEEDAEIVEHNGENEDENEEDDGIEDEDTTIFVNADLASTLTKLRRGMVPFLNRDFVDAIREAEKRGKENVQALLLEGQHSDNRISCSDVSSDVFKKKYAECFARNATHSENDADGVEIYFYT